MTMTTRLVFACAAVLATVPACVAAGPDDGDSGEGEGEGEPGAEGLPVVDAAWTYTVVEGAACGNGGDVGVATNRGTSDRLVIYLEGGGACWDDFTCSRGFASFVTTGIPASAVSQIESLAIGVFSRVDSDNPFTADSFAYVPYCTGDVHGGTRAETPWGVAHVGGDNIDVMLPRILATYPDATEVVLAGTSAGGYGVANSVEKLRALLPASVKLTAVMDSAIPLPPFAGGEAVVTAQNAAWEPALCEGCVDPQDRFEHLLETLPDVQFGLIQSLGDTTLRQFYSPTGLRLDREVWASAVAAFFDTFETRDNVSVFEIDVDQHVFVYETDLAGPVVDGVSVGAFLKGVVGDDVAVSARSR